MEKEASNDANNWEYTLIIGEDQEHQTTNCRFEGYKEKLFCYIEVSEKYANLFVPMWFEVNGCDSPIYEGWAELPPIK